MHENALTQEQVALFPLIQKFNRTFYLGGGTAIALYLGHRQSIDFDLFTPKKFKRENIHQKIIASNFRISKTLFASGDEYTIIVNNVKLTFFNYPFEIPHKSKFKNIMTLPSLLDLAAMKAYALGRRAKWKDYVDLFFMLKYHFSLQQISIRATELFNDLFSEKLFRAQLSFFDDVDYTEEINYTANPIRDVKIKEFLEEISTQTF